MSLIKSSIICASLIVLATACNSSGGGGSAAKAGQGTIVSPNSLDTHEYRDVRGQIFGSWQLQAQQSVNNGPEFDVVLRLYFKSDATAVRLTCSRSGQVFADLAGIVTSTIAANNITFNQTLALQQGDCQFNIPAKTVQFALSSDGGIDTASLDSGVDQLNLTRSTPRGEDPRPINPAPVGPQNPRFPQDPGHSGDHGGAPVSNMTVYEGQNCNGPSVTLDNDRSCQDQLRGMRVRSMMFFGQCQDLPQEYSADDFCRNNQRP